MKGTLFVDFDGVFHSMDSRDFEYCGNALVVADNRDLFQWAPLLWQIIEAYAPNDCGDFARLAVLPKLEGGAALMTFAELGERLVPWLESFGEQVTLATDSLAWDWPWIQEVFEELGTWPDNLDKQPEILRLTTEFNLAVEQAFARGLRRHHALDDAKANRLGWLAVQSAQA